MCIGLYIKYSLIKSHENSSSGSQVVACGRTDMTKLLVAFRNFAKALKNGSVNAGRPRGSKLPIFLQGNRV